MTAKEVFESVKTIYDITPDYPWFDDNAVLRHPENNKWFAVILKVKKSHLGLGGDEYIDVLNIKCDPILASSLRTQPGFYPAYHMNKDKWISILLDGTVSGEEIIDLIGMSYEMTMPKPRKPKKPKSQNQNL